MHTGIAEVELFLAVAENFAQARVMEQQVAVLIDDHKRRWTKIEYLAELAFVLCRFVSESDIMAFSQTRVRNHAAPLMPREN